METVEITLADKDTADFLMADHGSVFALIPFSKKANRAVKKGKIGFESWQMMGGAIMVDHRMVNDLIVALDGDGYTFAWED